MHVRIPARYPLIAVTLLFGVLTPLAPHPVTPADAMPVTARSSGEYNIYLHGFLSDRLEGLRASDRGPVTHIAGQQLSGYAAWPQTATPDGRFLLVASAVTPRLYVYSVGNDGRLTQVGSSATPLPDVPVDIVVSPDSRRAYLTLGVANVSVLAVELHDDGSTDPIGSPVKLGTVDEAIASAVMSADGQNLYVSSYARNELLRILIRPDGSPSGVVQRVRTGSGPIYPVLTPNGQFLYVANERSANVSGFRVGDDGALSPVPGSRFASGLLPHIMSVTRDGRHLYVPNMGSHFLSAYTIRADGSLAALPNGIFGTGIAGPMPEATVMSPSGRTLWALGTNSLAGGTLVLRRFAIGDNGTLVPDPTAIINSTARVADGRTLTLIPGR